MQAVTTYLTAIVMTASIVSTPSAPTTEGMGPPAGTAMREAPQAVEVAVAADPLTLVGHTQAEADIVDDLLDDFAAAGLGLPPLRITFAESTDECSGYEGVYRGGGDIIVCRTSTFTIAHEIAHAWAGYALTDADREEYRQLWDAPTWGSSEVDWEQRATENAANTIAWALLATNPEPHEMLRSHLCTYEALTGHPLPNPLVSPCGEIPPTTWMANASIVRSNN